MKEKCSMSACCNNPGLGLALVRIGVAVLFLIPGIMKFQDPNMFRQMLFDAFGFQNTMNDVAVWVVIIFEALGGLMILLGKLIPKMIYKIAVLGIVIISLVALFGVHVPMGNTMGILNQIMATMAALALLVTKPMCPCGMTGCKA